MSQLWLYQYLCGQEGILCWERLLWGTCLWAPGFTTRASWSSKDSKNVPQLQ
jgi:hypothetical protein